MTNPDYEMHLRPEEDYEMHFDDAGLKPEQTATVTPDYETQTVKPDPGCVFSEVTVEAITEPTEEIDITENGVVNVARYGTANVAVPVGVFPSGTKLITQNVTGEDVTNYAAVDVAVPGPTGTKQISITANGTTTEDVSDYADAAITVNTDPEKGWVFGNYDSDGFPHEIRFINMTEIPQALLFSFGSTRTSMFNKIEHIEVPEGVTTIRQGAFSSISLRTISLPTSLILIDGRSFRFSGLVSITIPAGVTRTGVDLFSSCTQLSRVEFLGDLVFIARYSFEDAGNTVGKITYDFSHCTAIPQLENVNAFNGTASKIFIVKQSLLTNWQNETNWVAVTNVTWEGV